LGTPASGDLSNCTGYPAAQLPSSIDATKIADGSVTNTEFQYINTLSSNAQTQITARLQLAGGNMTGVLNLNGGTTAAAPTPQLKFSNYYDSAGGPSISHIDLYGGTYGFGISVGDLDYISDIRHRFYSDTTAAAGGTPAMTVDGGSNRVGVNSASPGYTLDVTGDIRVTDDLFVDDFASLDSARVGATQTDPGTGNLYVEGNVQVDGKLSFKQPASIGNNSGSGEVAYFGTGTLTTGKLYYLNTSGVWTETNADDTTAGGSQLLGIALGSSPSSNGVLLRGFFDMTSYLSGTFNEGIPVYVKQLNTGYATVTQPSGTNDFVRVVGYCTSTANVIYFNPDGTYIKIA